VLNTDSEHYGGGNVGNGGGVDAERVPWHDQEVSAQLTLPPLAAVWLAPEGQELIRGGVAAPAETAGLDP
jgi:1,4-alpha-glucan branching enzyme